MKIMFAGLVAIIVAGFAVPAVAQDAAQVARALGPLSLAQYDNGGRRGGDTITCGSPGYKLARCSVPWRDAVLVRQTSDSSCVRGRSWGIDRGGIWVDKGCGGEFAEAGRGSRRDRRDNGGRDQGNNGDWRPGAGWDTAIRVRCASQGYHYNMCQVDTGRGSSVRVERQISNTRCEQGRTWGFNRAGIWVDGGCEAIFRVDRRWR